MPTREVRQRPGSCGACARFKRLENDPIRGRCAVLSPDRIRCQGDSACRSRFSPIGEPLREVPRCGICGRELVHEGRGSPRKICAKCEAERDAEIAETSGRKRKKPAEKKTARPAASPLRGMPLSRVAKLAHEAHMTYGRYVALCEHEGKLL